MRKSLAILGAGILVSLAATGTAAASTATYAVMNGNDGGDSVDATATFVLNCNTTCSLGVTLTNTENPLTIVDDGYAITGLLFNVSSSVTGTASVSGTGPLATLSGSNYSPTLTGNTALTPWQASTSLPTISISTLTGSTKNIILPYTTATNGYPDGNSSIGNKGPVVDGPATFTFTGLTFANGITSSTNLTTILSDVEIQFGTTGDSGSQILATFQAVPEPGTTGLCLAGVGLLLAGRRRRRAS